MRDLTQAGPADWTPAIFATFTLAETAGSPPPRREW